MRPKLSLGEPRHFRNTALDVRRAAAAHRKGKSKAEGPSHHPSPMVSSRCVVLKSIMRLETTDCKQMLHIACLKMYVTRNGISIVAPSTIERHQVARETCN